MSESNNENLVFVFSKRILTMLKNIQSYYKIESIDETMHVIIEKEHEYINDLSMNKEPK